jgi:membrane protease YdiL (CAAX protease family)
MSFRKSTWKTRWLIVGLAVLIVWRCTGFISEGWLAQFPWWLWFVVLGVIPQAFLLLFPMLTRTPRGRIRVLPFKRCLIEIGIATLLVIVIESIIFAAIYTLDRFSPETSVTPDEIKALAESSPRWITYALLLLGFTFVPVAEEVFFRGFLQNAFRARVPHMVATLAQSAIFGLGHFFGNLHMGAAALIGLALTIIYEWRKTLFTPILVHAGINAIAALGVLVMAAEHDNRPFLGVAGDRRDSACVVRHVYPGSAAEKAGFQVGDVIVSFNGESPRDSRELAAIVRRLNVGDTTHATVERSGEIVEIEAVLQRRGEQK